MAKEAKDATQIPAGHQRDEQIRINIDVNDEKVEAQADVTGAIDDSKLDRIDNEIARKANTRNGAFEFTGRQPGYEYALVPAPEAFGTNAARGTARGATRTMLDIGYRFVDGDMPEAPEWKGEEHAAGTTKRGCGDCLLMRIRREDWERNEQIKAEILMRQGQVEESIVRLGERTLAARGYANTAHANDDPYNRARGFMSGPRTTKISFTDADIRRGSIPGLDIGAQGRR